MKTIFLENGESKIINSFSDLPKMTTDLFEINLKLTPKKNIDGHNFGMPIFILFMFFVKFLSDNGLKEKTCSLLWKIAEDLELIGDLYNLEFGKKNILLQKQRELNDKLRLINNVNSILSKISWRNKFFLKKKIKIFCVKVNPLIYDNDIKGHRSHRFGHAIHDLDNIFGKDFKISTEGIKKSLIVV